MADSARPCSTEVLRGGLIDSVPRSLLRRNGKSQFCLRSACFRLVSGVGGFVREGRAPPGRSQAGDAEGRHPGKRKGGGGADKDEPPHVAGRTARPEADRD